MSRSHLPSETAFRATVGATLSAALLLLALAPAAAHAADPPDRPESDRPTTATAPAPEREDDRAGEESGDDAAPAARFAGEVQVTATLQEESPAEVASSVAVIDRQEIEARQLTTVGEALGTVPGLELVQSGPPGQVASLFTRGTASVHTLVLWNGVRLNNPYFAGFNWAFLPTEGVERIEIVRGPFSALYGSDAIGGVVQIVSGAEDGVAAAVETGEDGYRLGRVRAGAQLGELRIEAAGHLRRGASEFANSDFDSEALLARLSWQPSERFEVGLITRADDADTGIPFAGGSPDLDRAIAWRERELAVPVRMTLEEWNVEGSVARVEYESRFEDPDSPFGFTSSETESTSLRARSVASRALGNGVRLTVGGDWERLEVDDRSVFGVNLSDADTESWGAFGQLVLDLGRLRLETGLRRDEHSTFGAATSPRLGARLDLERFGSVHASWGEAFRAPSVGELFFVGSGNPELEPEESRGAELGWDWRGGPWHLQATAFRNRLENLIDFDFVTFSNVNIGRAETRGVELAAGWARGWLDVAINGTLQEAEDERTGLALLRRAEERGNLLLTARPGPWTVAMTVRWVGERPDVDAATFERRINPDYTRVDLSARYRFDNGLAPYARLENAADEEYAEVLGFPAPGRRLVAGIGWEL